MTGSPARRLLPTRRRLRRPQLPAGALLFALVVLASPAEALTTHVLANTRAGFLTETHDGSNLATASSSLHGVTSYAEFRIDPDDQDIELFFSITPGSGGFDSTVLGNAYARGDAVVIMTLTAAGVGAGVGSVQFLFTVTGRMDIDGVPVPGESPLFNFGVENYNFLHVGVGPPGNQVTELIFQGVQVDAASAQVFVTLVGTSALPVDFTEPVQLTIAWQGGASVQHADGDFVVSSDFLGTIGLQAVVLRDSAGNRIPGSFTTETGRALPVPEPDAGVPALLGFFALARLRSSCRGSRRPRRSQDLWHRCAGGLLACGAARPTRAAFWMLVAAWTLVHSQAQALPLTPIPCTCLVPAESAPSHVSVSPDGRHAYFGTVTGIVGRARNATTGTWGGALVVPTLPAGVRSSAFSPDGRHLYVVAATGDDRITVLLKGHVLGQLEIIQTVIDGEGVVDGLSGVEAVAVSPDGKHVYAVASVDDAIVAFARNTFTGTLSFLEVERDGVNGVDGMNGARALAISPDGRHVYVASRIDDAVVVFARDATTGLLSYVEDRRDGVAGFDGLDGAHDVVVSRDGTGVFVLGIFEAAISVMKRNPATGSLSFVEAERNGVAGVSNFGSPRALAFDPLRPWLYAASITEPDSTPGSLQIFEHDASTGQLVRRFFAAGDGGEHLTVSPDGRHLYPVGATADLVPPVAIAPLRYSTRVREGENGIAGLDFPNGLAAFGASLYAISSFPPSIAAFTRSGEGLDFVGAKFDGSDGVEGISLASGVVASPDGRHVYVTGNQDDAIATFERHAATGALTFLGATYDSLGGNDGLDGANQIAISDDGAHVYVAASVDHSVALFARSPALGSLSFVEVHRDGVAGVDGLDGATAIALSPDGKNVYATGRNDDAIAVFSRHPVTGALTFVEFEKDGVAGVTSMDDPFALAVSPDGRHVYVASREDDAIVIFGRAPSNGSLTFLGVVSEPVHLEFTNDVAVSPDGRLVFAIGGSAHTLVAYWRDPETGALGLAQTEKDDEGLVDGLRAPDALLAKGRHLYVTSLTDEAIAIFVPEPGAGAAISAALLALGLCRLRRRAGGH